ncbi:dihydrolipoyl dehydrogenase [Pseudoduganella namucuonensis]|uniref:Dihydrolipoyl dehydrogenase n=1 Tax=Pseudoduganella namucuonensis TaxID=1035707 RepID=A0A1I7LSP7_9BURK|nr:dihydrolipoyl dehydrogenase [Pseudoduganella namucuonensis]SFV12648.1 dihydrolipoamide dehydrogenase [Pseudoduganella namucuonensis]
MTYDLIIIGSGPGGYVAAIRASQLGLRTALVERAELGGVCLNWGCIPTKALLKSAQVFEYLQHAADYGIVLEGRARPDLAAMVKRSRDVAAGMSKGVRYLMKKNGIDVIQGHATLRTGGRVDVRSAEGALDTLRSRHVIIAVGARPRELAALPRDGQRVIGCREAMSLTSQPASMVIVGAGAIGAEFASIYASLGTRVTLVETQARIVPLEEPEVSAQLQRAFARRGVEVLTGATVEQVDKRPDGCTVRVATPGGARELECDIVLSAAGVTANLERLGLEEVGIATAGGRITVDRWYQTSVPGYYAIGDCIPGAALAHVASAEGVICVERIAGLDAEPLDYLNIPSCTYTQPELASVGYTEQAARADGYEVKTGTFPFSASGKAQAAGHPEGFVKLVFEARHGLLLGAHMVGANVTELIAEAVMARKLESTADELMKAVHPHPTMSEALMEAAAAAMGEAIHL